MRLHQSNFALARKPIAGSVWDFMIINDPIYGNANISDKVIIELLNNQGLRRLKGISQSGMAVLGIDRPTDRYSRYEHSVAVMLLLRKLGASLEEQVAGLLHDSSHTAFSHTIDIVKGEKHEDYAESVLEEYFDMFGISEILEKYSFDSKVIANYSKFSKFGLLERPIPELCADRIDNGLRYMYYAKMPVKNIAKSIIVIDKKIAFSNLDAARRFALGYLNGTVTSWGNVEIRLHAMFLAKALKRAFEIGILDDKTLYKYGEAHIYGIIAKSNDNKLKKYINEAEGKLHFRIIRRGNVKNAIKVKQKLRYVDPVFIGNDGILHRLTSVDKNYSKKVKNEISILSEECRVIILSK